MSSSLMGGRGGKKTGEKGGGVGGGEGRSRSGSGLEGLGRRCLAGKTQFQVSGRRGGKNNRVW